MYARSYDTHASEESTRALPSGYSGNAFEGEPCARSTVPPQSACEACAAEGEEAENVSLFSSLQERMPFLEKFKIPAMGKLSLGTLFSDTEDFLLIGLFLLLLLSKEGDPLCAVAVALLFFSGKV